MKFRVVLIAMFFFAFAAKAEVSFEAGVIVEAEAENAAAARAEALRQANREAFLKVAGRLVSPQNVSELNKLTDDQLLHFIREVTVVAEKSGSKNYRADLNVTINGELLKQYMQENNMLETPAVDEKVLIIPIYADTEYNGRYLWEDGNVWRSAWLEKGKIKAAPAEFVVVEDTSFYRRMLNPGVALNLDAAAYEQLRRHSGIGRIFAVQAVRAGRNNLVMIIKSYPQAAEKRFLITAEDGETLDKAISEAVAFIAAEVGAGQAAESSGYHRLEMTFKYHRLKEWLETHKKLEAVNQVKKAEAQAIESGSVRLVLEFTGTERQLRNALEKVGLSLESDNGTYILKQEKI